MLNITEIKALFPLMDKELELSLFLKSDISPSYIQWLNSPEVVKYSNQRFKQHTRGSCLHYLQSFENADALFLKITDKTTHTMLGTMTTYFNRVHKTADIGIMIGNSGYWGQGIGQRAWLLLLTTLLETVNVRKVTGGTLSCNRSMVRIMEKSGMKPDGVRIAQELIDGEPYDLLHFSAFA